MTDAEAATTETTAAAPEPAAGDTLRAVLEACAGAVPGDAWAAVLAAAERVHIAPAERGAAEDVARAAGAAVRAAEERAAAAVAAVLQQGTLFDQERAELKAVHARLRDEQAQTHARELAAAQQRTVDEQARVKRREAMLHKLNQELGAAKAREQRAADARDAADAQRAAAAAEAQRLRETSARYVATVSRAVLGQAAKFRACADMLRASSALLAFPDDDNEGNKEEGSNGAPATAADAGIPEDANAATATTTTTTPTPPQSPEGAAARLAREERRTSSGITSGRELVRAAVVESEKGLLQLMEETRVLHARAQRASETLVGLGEQLLAAHGVQEQVAAVRRECFWTLALMIKDGLARERSEAAAARAAQPGPVGEAKDAKKRKGFHGKRGGAEEPPAAPVETPLRLRNLEDLLDAATAQDVPIAQWPTWVQNNIVDNDTPNPDV